MTNMPRKSRPQCASEHAPSAMTTGIFLYHNAMLRSATVNHMHPYRKTTRRTHVLNINVVEAQMMDKLPVTCKPGFRRGVDVHACISLRK